MRLMEIIRRKRRAAFTLIEMLIVIVILGILAMIIIPQVSTSTDDAKLNTLRTNLGAMRSAVELYYAQHNGAYPGAVLGGAATPAEAFVQQLTRYTDAAGTIGATKTAVIKYGPYIKGTSLPQNSFNDLSSVVVDTTTANITTKASSGVGGWKFYALTGVLMANDGAHDAE